MQEFVCGCKYVRNFFLRRYRVHVTFMNDKQFIRDYKELLFSKGCKSDLDLEEVLKEVHQELERRINSNSRSLERARIIEAKYRPLNPDVFELKESFLAAEFLDIVSCAKDHTRNTDLLQLIKSEKAPQVYSFKVFTPEFSSRLMEELDHFEKSDLPKGRPNTMNNCGILLKETGFEKTFVNPLRHNYLMPLAKALYPHWVGEGLDTQRSFVVIYRLDEDVDLSYHYDNAEVTINISLGKDFEGGELFFGHMKSEPQPTNGSGFYRCDHRPNFGIIHRGQHMHGAMPIECGERYNLIIWMRSSSIRNSQCPMCDNKPNLVPVPFDGDGFTAPEVEVCKVI